MGFVGSIIGGLNDELSVAPAHRNMAAIYDTQGRQTQGLDELAAQDALLRGSVASGAAGRQGDAIIGAERAGYASSGVDIQSGTALDTQVATRALTAHQQNVIQNNAAREAWGLKLKGMQAFQQGQLSAYGEANNAQAADMKAIGEWSQAQGQLLSMGMSSGMGGGSGGGAAMGGGASGISIGSTNAGSGATLMGW